MQTRSFRSCRLAAFSLSVIAATALLPGCGRTDRTDDSRSVGQKVDSAIARGGQKADQMKADASKAGDDARQATERTLDSVGGKAKDLSITTEINAQLAKDDRLSALRINVDTTDGQVVLRGSAPDAAAKDRAASLARAISGVTTVDNQLTVESR